MKSNNWPNYLIALTVIGCSAVLLAALTFALSGVQWGKRGRTLQIEFTDSTGIKLHSPVRYAGAATGTVIGMRYLSAEERRKAPNPRNAVRVTVLLDERTPPIPSDVVATLASETILGEKFISLSAGSYDAPPLPEGSIIQGKDIVAFDTIASTAQAALDSLSQIVGKLNQDYPTLVPKIAELIAQGNSLLQQGSNFVQNVDGTVTNANGIVTSFKSDYGELIGKVDSFLAQMQVMATNADAAILRVSSFVGRTDTLVGNNEDNLKRMLEELRIVSQNLKVISTYTKALTGTLGEKPSRVIWGRKQIQLPTEQEILQSTNPVPIELPRK